MAAMQIVDFEPAHAPAFKAMNEAWITRYFTLEPKDIETLGDPQGTILAPGGQILMAMEDGEAVGCCALLKLDDSGYELAKMAVIPGHQGQGLGRALLDAAIERARAAGAHRIWLETNSALGPALSLYRSFGFKQVPAPHGSDYARADVQMELRL
jgi:ribosomal protein S18 acetylase RimI-like enzyme